MVIVKLMGGLGNQMFQYAVARKLSKNKNVYLDLNFLKQNNKSDDFFTARSYDLNIFSNLRSSILPSFISKIICSNSKITRLLKWFLPKKTSKFTYLDDTNIETKSTIETNLYLNGYFQNPLLFDEIRDLLLKEFTFPKLSKAVDQNKNLIKKSTNTVSIHIRRGDYLKANINSFHGLLPIEYYKNATELLNAKLIDATYFIFSDDPKWCETNFSFIEKKYIVSGNNQAWVDMYLMSQCEHHIVANSSFSWWGAWLNQNIDKIVIAPKKWFNSEETNIIPKEWISL
ncbi:alpha-1,2-fucosyltransferase [Pedobacter chinensis]|nr:alpha-1,2-fucosyltransferase [Pedobacter chinensis]